MAYIYSDFGYDGCSCLGEVPDHCKCGNVIHNDTDYCDECLVEVKAEEQAGILIELDDLGYFITSL